MASGQTDQSGQDSKIGSKNGDQDNCQDRENAKEPIHGSQPVNQTIEQPDVARASQVAITKQKQKETNSRQGKDPQPERRKRDDAESRDPQDEKPIAERTAEPERFHNS